MAYGPEGTCTSTPQRSDYGKLAGRNVDDMRSGARIEIGESKRDPLDFALWKGAKPGEPAWESPWGPGRPGWHIECSAMAMKYLGEQLDIHGGGQDLIFPHHENEIAQSESATGRPFANFWCENGLVNLGGEKMSKSTGNLFSSRKSRRRSTRGRALLPALDPVPEPDHFSQNDWKRPRLLSAAAIAAGTGRGLAPRCGRIGSASGRIARRSGGERRARVRRGDG